MPEQMTCADVLQELRRDGDVYITLAEEWVEVYQSDNGDRMCMVSDDVLRVSPDDARLLATALLEVDVDAMQAVVDAAVALVQATREGDGLEGERLNAAVEAYLAGLKVEGGDAKPGH